MADDVILNKVAAIERCLKRVDEEYRGHELELATNLTRQDSIVLNLQRACESTIDLAMHLVRARTLGLPQDSREAFTLLRQAGILDTTLTENLQRMVGFRNVAVHRYQDINLDIVRAVLAHRTDDFRALCRIALAL